MKKTAAEMITSWVSVKIVDSSKEAPNYGDDFTLLKAHTCIIVGRGTVAGNPTVDIQLTDEHGKKFLIMATGGIMEMIGAAVAGKRQRDLN